MATFTNLFLYLLLFFLSFHVRIQSGAAENVPNPSAESKSTVDIGAIFDLDSPEGVIAEISISLAIADFYALHSDYQTRLLVHNRSSNDIIGTAAAAVDLLKNVQVHAILGPQISDAAPFVIELGENAQVPIVSFFETSPTLSPRENPYFIRAALDDSVQIKAIATLLQTFEWYEAVLVYEDSDYGNDIISYLFDTLQEVDIRLAHMSAIPTSAEDFQISRELKKLMMMQTRVFIVHMTSSLGSRLFALADKAGMMSEGYVWLITSGLSNSLNAMDPEVVNSMEGVLGIRSHVQKSKDFENFRKRLKRNLLLMEPNVSVSDISIFGLWAYDTIWALASAVERIGPTNPSFLKLNPSKSTADFESLGTSTVGPRLLSEILNTKFKGLSGEFRLVNGQLKSTSPFEIFNVISGKGQRVVGFWTPDKGITKTLDSSEGLTHSTSSSNSLKKIIWPGDSTTVPKGWAIPNLKVGIPMKQGFNQFVKIQKNQHRNETTFSGFSIDVFRAVLSALDLKISHEFIPFENNTGGMNGTYDDLLKQIKEKKVDAVVGDTTIVASRTLYVDFTLPYSESGVTMLVLVKHDKNRSMWIFIEPWSLDLWLTAIAACMFIGLVLRIMEHRSTNTELGGPLNRQIGLILCLPFYALTLPEKQLVARGSSRFVMVIWLCSAFILMQSYTASLSSVLTIDKLQPTFVSVKELQRKGYYVGYQSGSFVENLLVQQLKFNETKLRQYGTAHEYHEALSKGSDNGGVAAIFDEVPYIRIFLANSKYSSKYMMAGPTYRTDGFGFAFPRDSPLVSYFSRAILRVREQGSIMDDIEKRYFGHKITSLDLSPSIPPDSSSLQANSFGGLFIIMGIATLLAIVISESYLWHEPALAIAEKFNKTFLSSRPSNGNESAVQIAETNVGGHSSEVVEDSGNTQRISRQISENISAEENEAENIEAHSS